MNTTSIPTGQLVDRFGRLKAEAAETSKVLDDIKTALIEREGEGQFEGELFRLSLSHSLRTSTDWKAVAMAMAKKAGVSDKVFDGVVAANTGATPTWVAKANARVTK